jgi:hypothetical protein
MNSSIPNRKINNGVFYVIVLAAGLAIATAVILYMSDKELSEKAPKTFKKELAEFNRNARFPAAHCRTI